MEMMGQTSHWTEPACSGLISKESFPWPSPNRTDFLRTLSAPVCLHCPSQLWLGCPPMHPLFLELHFSSHLGTQTCAQPLDPEQGLVPALPLTPSLAAPNQAPWVDPGHDCHPVFTGMVHGPSYHHFCSAHPVSDR